ncbi:NADH-quinone oxidoreductase subunit NuoG [Deinococcus sp. KNUC1210]|uniref:NADH-quinone oxidoreductase subunit NuoG n=1 Tax=Deinococcus sp. KNUC1210 TaxID=2917691 RepID=UPI001EEF7B25|nr:NADH-quinone oxidoreductase subunit NuoG [Deinococcus sp. KNUC1210]ULH16310.1 NADH-quinone oxidoreductase subunit NuoG [Deinococcus sp. KNUC1210]
MKVNIDGRELDLPAGTSALDAVFAAGGDVPYFCAHEYLSPVGACRMCLVEAGTPRKNPDGTFIMDGEGDSAAPKIFWFPKPMASCTLQATEGMHIRSTSQAVKKGQAGMMEFTLLNHPLDCPTCDKGGACELQDRAYEYGYGASRFGFDRRHADKHYPLSEHVILDQERCIHCKRCVRYFEEVPGQEVLDFIERGGHTFIDTQEGTLPEGFAGNITDICPVGALLDNVARFRGRNWEYDHAQTTCTLCPVGCSITADARAGRLERVVAHENREVNEAWICDAGRFGHVFASEERLTAPMVRSADGKLVAATWDAAISAIRAGLEGLEPSDLALYLHADSTLEEGIAAAAFATLSGSESVDFSPRYSVGLDSVPPTLSEVAQSDAVIVVGADLEQEAPVVELRIQEMLRGGLLPAEFAHGTAIADLRLVERPNRKRERLAVFASQPTRLSGQAGIAGQEGPLGVLQGLSGALLGGAFSSEAVKQAAELLRTAERPVLILGAEVLNGGADLLKLLRGLPEKLKVLAIPAGANARGLAHLNLVPVGKGLGYGKVSEARAALVSRLDPAAEGLLNARRPGFLIVHESHLTATALLADVVLPAATNYEKKGTTVNLEGRLLPLNPAAIDAGESADLIRALAAAAEALGLRTKVRGVRSAQTLLQERFGVDLAALPAAGQIVPLGSRYDAPTGLLLHPRLWRDRMRRQPESGGSPLISARQAELTGGDD